MPRGSLPPSPVRSWSLWVKPMGKVRTWSNLFLHGQGMHRTPGVWFYQGSWRLQVRSSTTAFWNEGASPDLLPPLTKGKWYHLAFSHREGRLSVWLNGKLRQRGPIAKPLLNDFTVYSGEAKGAPPARARLTDLRYFPCELSDHEAQLLSRPSHLLHTWKPVRVGPNSCLSKSLRPIGQRSFAPQRNHILAAGHVLGAANLTYSLTFWIQPKGIIHGWGGIVFRGRPKGENQQRNPCV